MQFSKVSDSLLDLNKEGPLKLIMHGLIILATSLSFASTAEFGFTEIAGTTDNYNIKDRDGFVDFSLVIPALTIQELMHFDLARVISPENDVLSILGRTIVVPSNLSLPKQVESYFLSFTLDKPQYRSYVRDLGPYNMYALQGTFPIKKVVDAAQGGQSIFEMVNLFTFNGGGSVPIDVKESTQNIKISINQWKLNTSVNLSAPNLQKGREILAFSLFQVGEEFYPSDIKRLMSGKTEKLATRGNHDNYVLSVLVNNGQQKFIDTFRKNNGHLTAALFGNDASRATFDLGNISYSLQKVSGTSPISAQLLPQMPSPALDTSENRLSFVIPQTIESIQPYLMFVTLSEVKTAGSESLPLELKNTIWTSEAMTWQSDFSIPTEATALLVSGKKYAWEVLYLATTDLQADSSIDWSKVSHVTRSTLTFNH